MRTEWASSRRLVLVQADEEEEERGQHGEQLANGGNHRQRRDTPIWYWFDLIVI